MKLSNIYTLLLAGFALTGATSCVDKVEYEPAEPVALAPYYFSTGNGDREDLEEGQSSFTILLGRLDAEKELEVPVEHNSDIDAIFNVPTSVKFAKGESTANLEVTFDLANVEKRKEYKLDLNLNGVENTPYYLGDLSMIIYYNPWESLGKGIYTDCIISSEFDIDSYTYEVEIQEHPTEKGYYRMVNPYGPGVYPLNGLDYGTADRYIYINAVDPEAVYVETSNTGFCANNQYGYVVVTSQAYLNIQDGETLEQQKEKELTGIVEESTKNIVMPVGTVLWGMTKLNNGAFSFNNKLAEFRLVLPGGKVVSDWEEVGFCNYTDGFCGPFLSTPVLNNTYQVYVEYNSKTNVYRVTNPFGPNSSYTDTESEQPSYLSFDVSVPKCVILGDAVQTTIESRFFGPLMATTQANIELLTSEISREELAEAGIGGTFEGKVIRIPGDQVVGYYQSTPTNYRYPKTPVDVVLDLTTATPSAKKSPRKVTMPLELRK